MSATKNLSKKSKGLTWKIVAGLFAVGACLIGMVAYYNIDPGLLLTLSFYEDLANPSIRIVRVQEGLRKEEIAEVMGDKLNWSIEQKTEFINAGLAVNNTNFEGHYFPKTYMIPKDLDPVSVTTTMLHEFSKETATVKKPKSKQIINPETALTIASIIQREAGSKNDMKLISGIIWNRLFKGMKLQID
ncbi:MAG: endolytic transglycosylase MltG, partial [Candidatus Paceibacterales bacterium]